MTVCSFTFQLLSFVKQCTDISLETVSQVRNVAPPSQKDRNVLDCHTKAGKHHCYMSQIIIIILKVIELNYLALRGLVQGMSHSNDDKKTQILCQARGDVFIIQVVLFSINFAVFAVR